MYRLTDDIAQHRALYLPPIMTVASVMVLDVPASQRGGGLSLGRYYAVLLESDDEIAEMESFLAAPRDGPVPPDLFDRRPSLLQTDHIVVTCYDPPAMDWPRLCVCRWPVGRGAVDLLPRHNMARGCYTMEMFDTFSALETHQTQLLASLGRERSVEVRTIAGNQLPATGSC